MAFIAWSQGQVSESVLAGVLVGRDRHSLLVVGREEDETNAVIGQLALYSVVEFVTAAHLCIERDREALAGNGVKTLGCSMAVIGLQEHQSHQLVGFGAKRKQGQ